MKKYIGTKTLHADPAWRLTGRDGHKHIVPIDEKPVLLEGETLEEGYKVIYTDGYESWSPKDVFEHAYRPTDNMNFGLAIEAMKMGFKCARQGWNGKNQYVELATCISYINGDHNIINVNHHNIGNNALAFVGTSGVQMGWLASQADMLADDWRIVG